MTENNTVVVREVCKGINKTRDEDSEEKEKMLPAVDFEQELDEFFKGMPVTEDTSCGFWMFKGPRLQKLANKKMFVLLYGISGMLFSSTYAYFSGTITTMEKRFKIPSKTMGIISVGNDITQLLGAVIISYYAGKGHRPRWIALGLYSVALFCFLNALPHLLYGPGEDALQLTFEYGDDYQLNVTKNMTEALKNKHLCNSLVNAECELGEVSMAPLVIWFVAQLISGIGGTLYYSLGYSYMDDNIKKSKSPLIISFTYFIRTMGPTMGYALVSIFLKVYIAPEMSPTIDNSDPRWLGAWWMGWLLLGAMLALFATLLVALPRELPRAAARKQLLRQKSKDSKAEEFVKPSIKDMMVTVKRLMTNSIYNYNQLSTIFYVFGYTPYWFFLPKYIETEYRQSASVSSLVTGTVGLVFSALGVLISGVILQRFKPRTKYMAFWNMIIGVITLFGILGYSELGCSAVDEHMPMFTNGEINTNMSCNADCKCDYVKFSPVCSMGSKETYISACHAGCTQQFSEDNGKLVYTNCSCIKTGMNTTGFDISNPFPDYPEGSATSGPCDVDCQYHFYLFLVIVCVLKLFGAMGRVTNFLVSVRCVEERDKTVSLGIGMSAISLFALVPAPIFYGYIMDSTCLVWGKTCTKRGNCWLYNAALLRKRLNYSSAVFFFLGIFFDVLVWWNVKELNMFDDGLEMAKKTDSADEATESAAEEKEHVKNIKEIEKNVIRNESEVL